MNCIIIEDEVHAQELLQKYIDDTNGINCIGVFDSVSKLPIILLDKVDLIFLDIQLPGMNGLEFINSLVAKPKIVITSAYRNYAIDAFEIDVTDYLLKPYSYKRFIKAITRVLSDYKVRGKDPGKEELFVYFDKAFHKININDIEYLKSEVDYIQIFGTHKKYLILDSLNHWEAKLKDFQFIRVHRSYIVNLKKVHKIEGKIIHLNKTTIPIGEKYKKPLFELIKD